MARALIDPPLDVARYPFAHAVRVRFAETDAMGVVHHAAYLPWLEEARVELLAHGGHSYAEVHSGGLDLAVVDVAIRYRRAIRFGESVIVHSGVAEATRSVVQIVYLVEVDGVGVASAVTSHACVNPEGRPLRVPDWLAALATDAPTALRPA
jgi:acyl-CoA thioester hydrolase